MTTLTDAIRQFDATEANLFKLQKLWKDVADLIPQGLSVEGPDSLREYENLCRQFRNILKAMPAIDGFSLEDKLYDLNDVFTARLDARELGEIAVEASVERDIFAQGEMLDEYQFQLGIARRRLARPAIREAIEVVDAALLALKPQAVAEVKDVEGEQWEAFKQAIAELDVLRGSAISSPERWGDLHRHMHFHMGQDLADIIRLDWPTAKKSLEESLKGPDDPLEVTVNDLGDLVAAAPSGRVAIRLKWDVLDDDSFERLVFNILREAAHYTNVKWLTKTKAPDRGRDISSDKVVEDTLGDRQSLRVIIQCRHWRSKSISIDDVVALQAQMKLWEPPKVKELVIASSGRFTTDAVQWIENHNEEGALPRVIMWAESHLEHLLASRPHLVAEFGLR